MTATATATPTPQLDRFAANLAGDDATLNDVASVLHFLADSDVDPARVQALCQLAVRALGRYDAHTRHAPPAALAEVVRESLRPCLAPSCSEDCAPWDSSTHGSPTCAAEAQGQGAFGDVAE